MDSSEEEFDVEAEADVEEDVEELPFGEEPAIEDYVGKASTFKWSAKEPEIRSPLKFDSSNVGFKVDTAQIKIPKDALMVCDFTNEEGKSRDRSPGDPKSVSKCAGALKMTPKRLLRFPQARRCDSMCRMIGLCSKPKLSPGSWITGDPEAVPKCPDGIKMTPKYLH